MRTLTNHTVEGDSANHQVTINVTDEPGSGGDNHAYQIEWVKKDGSRDGMHINFQNGPMPANGINGITQEALLAIVLDRLNSFQSGPFACIDNQIALGHCQNALDRLQERTKARIARGVEGTHTV